MDVRAHGAFRGDARLALLEFGLARLAQDIDGLVEIAASLGERLLAGHHTGLRLLPQFLNHFCRNFCHKCSPSICKNGAAAHGAYGCAVEINKTLDSNITPRSRPEPGPFRPQPQASRRLAEPRLRLPEPPWLAPALLSSPPDGLRPRQFRPPRPKKDALR